MAYNANSYFPGAYSQYQYPQYIPAQQTQTSSQSTLTWIQGEAAAKSYPVAPGGSALLLDSEAPVFYIKTVDASGMPLPLRVFDYTERQAHPPQTEQPTAPTEYVTREELEERLSQFLAEQRESAKPTVRREKANA